MKKGTVALLITVITVLLLFVGMSYFIGTEVFAGSTQLVTCEETSEVGKGFWKKYNIDYDEFCSTYMIEKLENTSSFDGHTIPADYIYALGQEENKDNQTVILVHGLGGNRYSNYPLAEMFLQKGYNVLTYDQRSSNENTAQYTTFGNVVNKMELGFSYEDANVSDAISDVEIPVLVINSEADKLTPQFMGQDIYDSVHNEEMKMIWTVKDSAHTEMWLDYNQEYREKVQELLNYIK